MKLLIICGFLGSGKTTLLLRVARRLSSALESIAIIENEIGEVGVDGDYLRLEGLYVQELFGGCICCTLSTGLIETLTKLEQLYQPDLVILEATGVARPGDIIKSVLKYRSKETAIQVITLVDATRYEMLMKMLVPLITSQIQAADIVAVNKIDQVEQEAVETIIQEVSRLNTQAKVIAISADKQTNMDLITTHLF